MSETEEIGRAKERERPTDTEADRVRETEHVKGRQVESWKKEMNRETSLVVPWSRLRF